MASLFSPKIPQEDPATKQLREAEASRAEADRIKAAQAQLGAETFRRSGGYGLRSLLGPLGFGGGLRSLLGSG